MGQTRSEISKLCWLTQIYIFMLKAAIIYIILLFLIKNNKEYLLSSKHLSSAIY